MKTFTTYAEKKANQLFNLLQGYTKGIRFTAILILLLMGVSKIWAYDQSAVDLYFDNSTAKWTNCYVYIGHGSYTSCYAMSRVSGTQYLWKLASNFNGGNKWGDASGWVVSNEKWWDNKDQEDVYKFVYHGNNNVTNIRTSAWNATTIYKADGTQSVTHYSTACTVYKWATSTKSNYTVTINSATGGTLTVKDYDNYTVSNGASKVKLTVLKFSASPNTGYSLSGVQINNGSQTTTIAAADISSQTYTLTSNVTITPVWTAAKYAINYKDQGNVNFTGTHASGYPTQHTYGTATTLKTASKTGYTFGGWFTTQDCSGSAVTTLGATAYTAAITLYAKWTANKYTVTLDNQSATTAGTASVQAIYGSAMPSVTIPQKTGYTFGGYYTAINGGGTKYYNANGSSAKNWDKTAATTPYAKWTANQYTITYKDQNNANFSGSHASGYPTKHTYGTATTLKDATKTGYTFGGWHTDQACTQKVTSLGATAYTAAITLYAKWTINQYTLTYSAGEGGSVTGTHESGAKYDYNTSIKLTAKPSAGNVFVEWVNESGTMVSTANPYTFNLTANKTVKAEFAPPTTVYLKPEGYWPADEARFAIYTWGAGKTERWVEMQHVDCENQYYSANIPTGYSDFKYVRLDPAGKGNASKDDGLHWDYKWGETGDLTLQGEDKNLYVTQRIYFKPHANWTQAKARFAAYFFVEGDGEKVKWMSMFKDGDIYWCNIPNEHSYNRVIFARMNPDNEVNSFDDGTKWNQTGDLTLSQSNLYTLTGGEWNNVTGSWSTHWETFTTPTYPLTLKATPYGEYTVKCNGVSHTSSRTKDIVIDLPVGATVEITKAESYDAAYNNNLVIKTSSNSQYEKAELNTTYTFCGETTIEENFTTTADHVVYLRVATSGDAAEWNNKGTINYVYSISNLNRLNDIVGTVTKMDEVTTNNIYKENDFTYYTCTIPKGCNTFRFERKTGPSAGANNYTEYFEHLLPLGQSNCFTIKGKNTSLGTFYGDWALGTANGDFRVLYVEQQVAHGTDENAWKTVINTTYQHSSDIIKKGDGETIVSLHIKYDKTKHPEVILQKFTDGKWVDVEGQAHMVLGPLTASADMAMLPGRRNTEGDANLRYGDGIEKIKDDAANGIAGRVWNFVVQQSGTSAYIDFTAETFAPYEGNYYIRTDNAAGGWMTYAIPGNVMSHSEYSLEHSGYSHYFCKWVDKKDQNDPEDKIYTPNTKFVVANKYGAAISDTIVADDYTDGNGTLEADANVRWMWNEYTNIGSRAYIAGSSVSNFLVAKYVSTESQDKIGNFKDKGEWVYEADLTNVQIDDKLTSITATYDDKSQELLEQKFIDENGGLVMLTSTGNARTTYTVRVIYDFKINKTIVYLIPTANDVTTSIDVIIERTNQDEAGEATQVKAAIKPANAEGLTVYGLITLTQDHITDPHKSEQEALTYWISFPFDVKIGDITGFGEVGKHWMIKYYDGAERAAKGWFLDTKTFWKFFLDTEDVMKANTGYVLTLNKSLLNASNPVYDNTKILKLYFPSKEKIKGEINSNLTETSVTLEPLKCNITSPADRTTKDSHWNLIGVPSYAHKTNNKSVKFFYDYDFKKDAYSAEKNAGPETFHAMHAYMVQFAGTIDWSTFTTTPAQLAAKKNADAEEQYTLRLELQQNGTKADQTFVELHDDATTMFDMNVDLTKMFNTGANIYTLIGSETEVAANVLPIANTVIPVGVQIATAGEYTFAMPDGTDGIVVELIDYETNTTTNLMLDEYTVDLAAGTFENRFALIVKPNKVATDMENITTPSDSELRKFIIDGKLYMQKDGMLYDAQGHIVR